MSSYNFLSRQLCLSSRLGHDRQAVEVQPVVVEIQKVKKSTKTAAVEGAFLLQTWIFVPCLAPDIFRFETLGFF